MLGCTLWLRRLWCWWPQVQQQMVILDEGRMSTVMGFPRIMERLGVLEKSSSGSKKGGAMPLGHGKPILQYKLVKDTGHLQKFMDCSSQFTITHLEVRGTGGSTATSVQVWPKLGSGVVLLFEFG